MSLLRGSPVPVTISVSAAHQLLSSCLMLVLMFALGLIYLTAASAEVRSVYVYLLYVNMTSFAQIKFSFVLLG